MKKFEQYKQGIYKPIHREKCVNTEEIHFRSKLELQFMQICDRNKDIVKWGSETVYVPYYNTVKNRMARYFVDFYVELGDGTRFLAEVKPHKEYLLIDGQTVLSKSKKKKSSTILYETFMLQMNRDKWAAAKKYCKEKNIDFRIITEIDIQQLLKHR
jgi:hypothetical protein